MEKMKEFLSCGIRIRPAVLQDAEEMLQIYVPYVEKTAITFEYDVPDVNEFKERMRGILQKYPWLAAERNGEIHGYAYAGTFKDRAAYAWAVETSIYVSEDHRRSGIGGRLYRALENILAAQNILNLNACIAYSDDEDIYLTQDSVRFHEKCGYHLAGRFHRCGYKFERWYDMVWMEKMIGRHAGHPDPVRPFTEIGEQEMRELLQ